MVPRMTWTNAPLIPAASAVGAAERIGATGDADGDSGRGGGRSAARGWPGSWAGTNARTRCAWKTTLYAGARCCRCHTDGRRRAQWEAYRSRGRQTWHCKKNLYPFRRSRARRRGRGVRRFLLHAGLNRHAGGLLHCQEEAVPRGPGVSPREGAGGGTPQPLQPLPFPTRRSGAGGSSGCCPTLQEAYAPGAVPSCRAARTTPSFFALPERECVVCSARPSTRGPPRRRYSYKVIP